MHCSLGTEPLFIVWEVNRLINFKAIYVCIVCRKTAFVVEFVCRCPSVGESIEDHNVSVQPVGITLQS
jgi:hypothetical protein